MLTESQLTLLVTISALMRLKLHLRVEDDSKLTPSSCVNATGAGNKTSTELKRLYPHVTAMPDARLTSGKTVIKKWLNFYFNSIKTVFYLSIFMRRKRLMFSQNCHDDIMLQSLQSTTLLRLAEP